MQKAMKFEDILNATTFTVPIEPNDPFYTDLSDFRGTFKEKKVFKYFGINPKTMEISTLTNSSYAVKKTKFYPLKN